jgi:hypothetical protein
MTDTHRLDVWLQDNVLEVRQPSKLVLCGFKFNWSSFTGSFSMEVEGKLLDYLFELYVGLNGFMHFREPVFHSPLGVPASYSAINIDSETKLAISDVVSNFFPKFRAYGFHKDLNKMIDSSSSMEERVIDQNKLTDFKSKLSQSILKLTVIG